MDMVPNRVGEEQFVPRCTVVIPTRDRPLELDQCLQAVTSLDYPRFDVLVVDNAPRDKRTQEVAARWGARYVIEPRVGVNRARNCGARASNAEIVAYLDDDAVPEPGWLANLVSEFRNPLVMAAAGRILPLRVRTEAERLFALKGGFDRGLARLSVDQGTPHWFEKASFGDIGTEANMAFRRSAFDEWTGFDERLGRGTALGGGEAEYAFFSLVERGYRVVYTPRAVVYHPYPQTLEDLRSRQLRILASTAGYVTLLFFEHRRYRRRILRFVLGRFRGVPRTWQAPASGPSPRMIPRWRILLACLRGPFLYARTVLAQRRSPLAISSDPIGCHPERMRGTLRLRSGQACTSETPGTTSAGSSPGKPGSE